MEPIRLSIIISSDIRRVKYLGRAVRAICVEHGGADELSTNIESVVVMAASNAINYAYNDESRYTVKVDLELFPEYIVVTVIDNGVPLPDSIVEALSDPQPPVAEQDTQGMGAPESGWGLPLIKSVCEKVTCERLSTGNRLRMTFVQA